MQEKSNNNEEQIAAELAALRQQVQIDQALEPVRIEIASMQRTEDLDQVIKVLGEALQQADIDFDQLGVNIFNAGGAMTLGDWLTADGSNFPNPRISVREMRQNHNEKHAWDQLQDYWRRGEIWQRRQGVEWVQRKMGRYKSEMHRDPADTEVWIVDVPFTQGTLAINRGWHHATGKRFSDDELAILKRFAEVVSLGYTRFADFQRLEGLVDELKKELQTAHDLQMGLMPTEAPNIPGFDIGGRCIPASQVGGDFFQYFQQDNKLALCLADVTGHAMEAAVPVMMFSGVLKTEMRHGPPLDQLFNNLNQTMYDSLASRTFVCFCMGEVDLATHHIRLANGGCPFPLHFSAQTGQIAELQTEAYPLGVSAETDYHIIEQPLSPGDYLIFCSDGLIEATNAEEEIYGYEQTAETIRQACAAGLCAEALIDRLVSEVQVFVGDEPQSDDMTCVALHSL